MEEGHGVGQVSVHLPLPLTDIKTMPNFLHPFATGCAEFSAVLFRIDLFLEVLQIQKILSSDVLPAFTGIPSL